MNRLKTIAQRAPTIIIDIRNIPNSIAHTITRNKQEYIRRHIKSCKTCPNHRKKTRTQPGSNECLWYKTWVTDPENPLPVNFGIKNFLRYYLGSQPDLTQYQHFER